MAATWTLFRAAACFRTSRPGIRNCSSDCTVSLQRLRCQCKEALMLLRKTLAALAICVGIAGATEANARPALPDLDSVPTAYMRHGHHYGWRHAAYRPHYRYHPYRYGYYRRAYHPYRYGYYRRAYHPYRYGYYRRYHPRVVHYYGAPYYRPHRGVSFS